MNKNLWRIPAYSTVKSMRLVFFSKLFSGMYQNPRVLSLALIILCSKTLADQQNLVNEEDSQTILQKAKDYSASIIGVSDSRSILSDCTNTNTLGLEFDFDASLLGSKAYRSAHRSNLRQLTSKAVALEPRYSSLSSFQHATVPPQSILGLHEIDIPLLNNDHDPSYHNESSNSELDANTTQFKQLPKTCSDRIADYPCQPPVTVQKSATTPDLAAQAQGTLRYGSQSPRKRDAALTVSSPSLASANAVAIPNLTLLGSLRKYWHARTMNQAANGSEAWGSLAARQNTVYPYSTETPVTKRRVKVLILGASESGKTTLLKNIRLYTGGGYTCEERAYFAEINRKSIVQSIRVILEAMQSLGIPLQQKKNEHHAQYILMWAAQAREGCSAEAATAVTELWADAGVQEAFRRRHEYQLTDSVSYFASHIQRVAALGYSPSEEDILRSRVKTTRIRETVIHMDDRIFCVFNVGGVRGERRKWIHTFENVDSIVFTVDTCAYCRKLFEDESVNRMREQLELWDSIANSRWFTKTNFVLVFTKIEALSETMELCPVTEYFPDFQEPVESCGTAQIVESYLAFLKEMFVSLMKTEEARQRTQAVFADLVHISDKNPAGLVLEILRAQYRDYTDTMNSSPMRAPFPGL